MTSKARLPANQTLKDKSEKDLFILLRATYYEQVHTP